MSETIKLVVSPMDSINEKASKNASKRMNQITVEADSVGSSEDLIWYRVAESDRRTKLAIHGLTGNAAPAYLAPAERDRLRDAGVSVNEFSVRNAGQSDLVLFREFAGNGR